MFMFAKQLSVFLENRQGRLGEVLTVLKENDVNILSISLADTTEFGLLRLMVNDPEKGKERLKEKGFSTMLSNVLIVALQHKAGSLQKVLQIISENGENVEYMYGLSANGDDASVVLKVSNDSKVEKVLAENGVKTLTNEQVSAL
ncbi:MAG: amino acid-binding protein [Clostridiales bacterium]|nr:amino acid-binding protein [Clostridiales bacterium]